MTWAAMQGDVMDALRALAPDSVDAIVTDPPYGLSFMGKDWDSYTGRRHYQRWCESWAIECLRVLKPCGHMLAFGGTRTYHRLACAVEDAGFEIRDSLHWIYGSGFPKSRDISKAIDSEAGAEREMRINERWAERYPNGPGGGESIISQVNNKERMSNGPLLTSDPVTQEAKQWQGYGTALKPAHEPIILARKPFEGTIASNVLEHGTGAVNIDGCRIAGQVPKTTQGKSDSIYGNGKGFAPDGLQASQPHSDGRWPPNLLLSHSPHCLEPDNCSDDCPVAEMDRQSGVLKSGAFNGTIQRARNNVAKGAEACRARTDRSADKGGASRFFPVFRYQAKAPKSERPVVEGIAAHPTVKPLGLMRWLVRLVTPPGGIVLDPFGGTGTTAQACEQEGFNCLLIEREPGYIEHTKKRMAA